VHSRPATAALLREHGLAPRRDLGQNFVTDPNTVRRIARLASVGPGDHVIEVGAGLGSLTLALAETGADVTALEVDRGVVAVLRSVVAEAGVINVRIVEGDAMASDWTELTADAERWALVANLPYNIATPLVADLLDDVPAIERMLVMVQREVGERWCAPPGSDPYGAISVKIAYWSIARLVGSVPASVFLPRPNVESVLVAIERRPSPAVDVPPRPLFELVRAAFAQRRKMLRRSLAGIVDPSAFAAAGVDASRRPEELDVHEWAALTRAHLAATAP